MTSRKTTARDAKAASTIFKDGRASRTAKSVAGSAISQAHTAKRTSVAEARTAAKVLASPNAPKSAKNVAASVLSQKNRTPFPVKTYRVAGSSLTQKATAEVVRKVAGKGK